MDDITRLQSALRDNLEVRGVLQRLKGALVAEIGLALRGGHYEHTSTGYASSLTPDAILTRSLIADYLRSNGLFATLAVFAAETGNDIGPTVVSSASESYTSSSSTPTTTATESSSPQSQGNILNNTENTLGITPHQRTLNQISIITADNLSQELVHNTLHTVSKTLLGEDDNNIPETWRTTHGPSAVPTGRINTSNSSRSTPSSSSSSPTVHPKRRYAGYLNKNVIMAELGIHELIDSNDTMNLSFSAVKNPPSLHHPHSSSSSSSSSGSNNLPGYSVVTTSTLTNTSSNPPPGGELPLSSVSPVPVPLSSPTTLLEHVIHGAREHAAVQNASQTSWIQALKQSMNPSDVPKVSTVIPYDPSRLTQALAATDFSDTHNEEAHKDNAIERENILLTNNKNLRSVASSNNTYTGPPPITIINN